MILSTMNDLPGCEVTEVIGEVWYVACSWFWVPSVRLGRAGR